MSAKKEQLGLMEKTRALLLMEYPFFGMLSLRLKLIADEYCPTASTDGRHLSYNPSWIKTLSHAERVGLFMHEILHVAFLHVLRRGSRNPIVWNIACDAVVNAVIAEAGITLPAGGVPPAKLNETAEELYKKYYKEFESSSSGGTGNSSGSSSSNESGGEPSGNGDREYLGKTIGKYKNFGSFTDAKKEGGEKLTENEQKIMEQEIKVAVVSAVQQSANRGTIPASIKRMVEELVQPRLDWKQLIRIFVEENARNDYNWTRPNRRFLPGGIYLPELKNKELGSVVVAVDTSGSVGNRELTQFLSEVSSILEEFNTTIYLLPVDSKVHDPQEYTQHDLPLKAHTSGGGGTSFKPPFEYVEQNDIQPNCFIYLTDGYCDDFIKEEPEYPVMWVVTRNYEHIANKAPYGTVLKLEVE